MARILVHVEGESEETFVNEVLSGHLANFGHIANARLLGNSRLRSRRGGIRGWDSSLRDIVQHLKSDPTCYATTLVDYYALPQTGPGAWPGRATAALLPFELKAQTVTLALSADIARIMGEDFRVSRFVPFVMMHEFEGLLFSDCSAFARGIGRPSLEAEFQAVRDAFNSPEEINDSPQTAPSKRVRTLVPGYEKPLMGALAILEIGIERIRKECSIFDSWVKNLEALP